MKPQTTPNSLAPLDAHWAILPDALNAIAQRLDGIDLAAARNTTRLVRLGVERMGSAAIIPITGTLTKYPSIVQAILGGTASTDIMAAVRTAAADDSIETIVLDIDSPGGSVAGVGDAADAVFQARSKKRVLAVVSDLCASAAFFIASQAHEVIANPTALIGSIGTYATVFDWSKAAASMGIEVHVVRAGKFKGAGTRGTKITAEQLEELQRVVDSVNGVFLELVQRGRRLDRSRVEELADGRVHVARDALSLRLIDRIGTLDEVVGRLRTSETRSQQRAASTVPAPVASAAPHTAVPAPTPTVYDFPITEVEKRVHAGARRGVARSTTMSQIAETNPDLHHQYLAALGQ